MRSWYLFLAFAAMLAAPNFLYAQCGGGPSMGGMGSCGGGPSMGHMMFSPPPMRFAPPPAPTNNTGTVEVARSSSPWAPQGAAKSQQSTPERSLAFYVNAERQRQGLPPVKVTSALTTKAERIASEQGSASSLSAIDKGCVARNNADPSAIVKGWMKTPALAERILASEYRECGFAQVTGSDGKSYWALVMGN